MNKKYLAGAVALALLGSTSVMADDWTFRIAATQVSPNDDSSAILGNDRVAVDSDLGLGFSLAYHIDEQWSVELLAALPFTHDISVSGGPLDGVNVGDTKHLPPTITMNYTWGDDELKYHVGLGINYTKFFDESTSDLTAALGTPTSLDIQESTGLAMKFGLDYKMTDDWNFYASVYYLSIESSAYLGVTGLGSVPIDVQIDPWVIQAGVSTSF